MNLKLWENQRHKRTIALIVGLAMMISTVSGLLPLSVSAVEAGNAIKSHDVWDPDPDPLRNSATATGYFDGVPYTATDDHCVDVYKVVDESTEEIVDDADVVGSDDNTGASTNDPQDATTRTGTGSMASFPWVLLIVGMIGAAVTLAAMAIYRKKSS